MTPPPPGDDTQGKAAAISKILFDYGVSFKNKEATDRIIAATSPPNADAGVLAKVQALEPRYITANNEKYVSLAQVVKLLTESMMEERTG